MRRVPMTESLLLCSFKDQIYDVFKFLPSKVQVGLFGNFAPDLATAEGSIVAGAVGLSDGPDETKVTD